MDIQSTAISAKLVIQSLIKVLENEGVDAHSIKFKIGSAEEGCESEDLDFGKLIDLTLKELEEAKAQVVPEGFGLFDGDTLTYSNGYSINCSFDDEFDCHVFDVSKDGCYIKSGMTQLEQAHCLVLSMIKLDAKDSTLEAQEPANDQ